LTLTTLRQLDGRRKGLVIRFLAESGLILEDPWASPSNLDQVSFLSRPLGP
jgi:hypothetical protein